MGGRPVVGATVLVGPFTSPVDERGKSFEGISTDAKVWMAGRSPWLQSCYKWLHFESLSLKSSGILANGQVVPGAGFRMQLPPLTNGWILSRYKRFLADVELTDGRKVTAHVPNTGRMTGCWRPGAPVQLSHSDDPRRKLAWTLERVDMGAGWVGVNTQRVNEVVAEAIEMGRIPSLAGYERLLREVKWSEGELGGRLDLVLEGGGRPRVWIEVKNTTLVCGDAVCFPDAVTTRGRKHLELLARLRELGERAVILYAVNRPEGAHFEPAAQVDPQYAQALRRVQAGGVEVLALRLRHRATAIEGTGLLPVVLS